MCNSLYQPLAFLLNANNGRFPHAPISSMHTAQVRQTQHRVLIYLPFAKCHWDVTNDRNSIRISIIHIDNLSYVTYEN